VKKQKNWAKSTQRKIRNARDRICTRGESKESSQEESEEKPKNRWGTSGREENHHGLEQVRELQDRFLQEEEADRNRMCLIVLRGDLKPD
jgi:hypothetical protein